jgi:hypothetical protein
MHLCLRQNCRPAFPTKRAVSSRNERHVDLHVCVRIFLLMWNPPNQSARLLVLQDLRTSIHLEHIRVGKHEGNS